MEQGNGPRDPLKKIVENHEALADVARGLQAIQRRIVVTVGSWDILHIGHVRYLRRAREFGDMLIVGVDTDETVKKCKGELRPVVPYVERCEMLTYQSCVDFVTRVHDVDAEGRWQYSLIKAVRPDVFVAVEDSYPEEQLNDIRRYCREVIVLPRQAEDTSTTNMIQNAVKKHLEQMYELIGKKKK